MQSVRAAVEAKCSVNSRFVSVKIARLPADAEPLEKKDFFFSEFLQLSLCLRVKPATRSAFKMSTRPTSGVFTDDRLSECRWACFPNGLFNACGFVATVSSYLWFCKWPWMPPIPPHDMLTCHQICLSKDHTGAFSFQLQLKQLRPHFQKSIQKKDNSLKGLPGSYLFSGFVICSYLWCYCNRWTFKALPFFIDVSFVFFLPCSDCGKKKIFQTGGRK